ncbi:MFS transporter [Streptomyces sp. V3I7]|uniref:MFS transporter n=1 Tax=Streptomyces sp. V3I7 TaxID=3042278 RepID=UPI00278AB8A6|nr:MFS transporter [Streptomyces sp. V3I7]MDQ0993889.1 MFS family permease [Streptomyces sp. V3I7]
MIEQGEDQERTTDKETATPGGVSSLWRHRDFLLLWVGESISQVGTQVTQLALPLTAVLALDASAGAVGILNALVYVPFIGFALYAGVWVDRCRRRPIMIAANIGRGLLLCTIPALAQAGALHMWWIYTAALAIGVCTVLFDVCYQSYLPTLVERHHLTNGNSKLESSASFAQAAGPGIGGVLVQLLTAPFALLANSFSLAVSVVTLCAIRRREERPPPREKSRSVLKEMREGLGFTLRSPYLRTFAFGAGTYNLFWNAQQTVFVVYAARVLHMSPGLIGVTLGFGAVGALIGATVAERLARTIAVGRLVTGSLMSICAAPLLMPLASKPGTFSLVVLLVSFFIGGVGLSVWNVHVLSLRQTITPARLLGRANASYRFLTWGPMPLGALLGGGLIETIGFHWTLIALGIGFNTAWLWVVFSPVPRMRAAHAVPAAA